MKNLKLCPFVTNDLLQILSTSQTLLLTTSKTTTGLPVDITWLLVADNGFDEGVAVSIRTVSGYFVLLRTVERPKCYERPTKLLNFCPHHIFSQTNAFLATSR